MTEALSAAIADQADGAITLRLKLEDGVTLLYRQDHGPVQLGDTTSPPEPRDVAVRVQSFGIELFHLLKSTGIGLDASVGYWDSVGGPDVVVMDVSTLRRLAHIVV